jgi:hypothetical protein
MKKIIYTAIIVFILCGCRNEKQSTPITGDFVAIDAKNVKYDQSVSIPTSDFFDKIDIIPLEFTDSCILAEIRKIVIYNDNIFVIEYRSPKTVYRFDIQGNFLNQIGAWGQGPKEIVELMDFSINEEEQTIYLLDNAKRSITNYTFDGQFINSIKINQYANRFEYKNGLFYMYMDQPVKGDLYSLSIRNMQGGLENNFFESKGYPLVLNKQTFSKSKDNLLIYKTFNDTIYSINGMEVKSAYHIDFGSFKFKKEEIEDVYTDKIPEIKILMEKERVTSIHSFFQVKNWFCFDAYYKISKFSFMYNINTEELKVFSQFMDDMEYMFFSNKFYGQTENQLIGLYDVEYISKDIDRFMRLEKEGYISKDVRDKQMEKMKKISRGDNEEEMNPWVLLYHFIENK